jgi:hypothetical protein
MNAFEITDTQDEKTDAGYLGRSACNIVTSLENNRMEFLRTTGQWELEHALGLAALSVAMCIVSMVKYIGDQPLWYSIALMVLSILGALIGGYYRGRKMKAGGESALAD